MSPLGAGRVGTGIVSDSGCGSGDRATVRVGGGRCVRAVGGRAPAGEAPVSVRDRPRRVPAAVRVSMPRARGLDGLGGLGVLAVDDRRPASLGPRPLAALGRAAARRIGEASGLVVCPRRYASPRTSGDGGAARSGRGSRTAGASAGASRSARPRCQAASSSEPATSAAARPGAHAAGSGSCQAGRTDRGRSSSHSPASSARPGVEVAAVVRGGHGVRDRASPSPGWASSGPR